MPHRQKQETEKHRARERRGDSIYIKEQDTIYSLLLEKKETRKRSSEREKEKAKMTCTTAQTQAVFFYLDLHSSNHMRCIPRLAAKWIAEQPVASVA